jgi:toxin ParE1/3/4
VDYQIVWTERARADLRGIVATIAADRPSAVEDWGNDLFRHIEVLASFPAIGPVVSGLTLPATRRIVYGNYLVFYRVHPEPKRVELVSVWHAARGQPDFL